MDLNRFEARIIGGCHSLCEHVQHIAGDQQEDRAGIVSLIGTVKEIGNTVNTVRSTIGEHQGSLGMASTHLETLKGMLETLDQATGNRCHELTARIERLE